MRVCAWTARGHPDAGWLTRLPRQVARSVAASATVIALLRRLVLVQPNAARAVSRLRRFGFIGHES
jgi:hypothetical protein